MPETGLMRVVNPNPQDYSNPLKLPFALLGRAPRSRISTSRFA